MPSLEPIKILIADDHSILRKTLATFLSKKANLEVVGGVGDTSGLVEQARLLQPDVLLLDVNMPGIGMPETVAAMRTHCKEVKILVLTASKNRKDVLMLLEAGVDGYILKEDDPEELLHAIHTVAEGEEWFSPRIAKVLVSSVRALQKKEEAGLTEREIDVLRLMVQGMSNQEIADKLYITKNTTKNHVRNLMRKLDVSTRVKAVVVAIKYRLVDNIPAPEEKSIK